MRSCLACLLFLVRALSVAVVVVKSEIYSYQSIIIPEDAIIYAEHAMYSPNDAPALSPPGNGRSHINLENLRFSKLEGVHRCPLPTSPEGAPSPCATNEGKLDLAVMERSHWPLVGREVEGQYGTRRFFCCTPLALSLSACVAAELGQMIFGGDTKIEDKDGMILRRRLTVGTVPTSLLTGGQYEVSHTDMHVVVIANCDPRNGEVKMEGSMEWLNPFGWLPGEEYWSLPYYKALTVIYMVLFVSWYVLLGYNYRDLLGVQLWISAVLVLGMAETAAKYYDLREWNAEGSRSVGAMTAGVLLGVTKKALSRILVLVIAVGYGFVRPALGDRSPRILAIGGAFFITASAYELLSELAFSENHAGRRIALQLCSRIFLVGVAVIDAVWCLWVLREIVDIIALLTRKGQVAKAGLYKSFRLLLCACIFISVPLVIFVFTQESSNRWETQWHMQWAIDSVWEVLYLILLLGSMLLLLPSKNSQRFAYREAADSDPEVGGVPPQELRSLLAQNFENK
jgi:hypothetical protein